MDVFYEAGEAIGNVGRRLFRRRRARQAEEALTRWSQQVSKPQISSTPGVRIKASEEVIDVEFRILEHESESEIHEGV